MKKMKIFWMMLLLIGLLADGCSKQEDENQNTAPDPDKRQVFLQDNAFDILNKIII